ANAHAFSITRTTRFRSGGLHEQFGARRGRSQRYNALEHLRSRPRPQRLAHDFRASRFVHDATGPRPLLRRAPSPEKRAFVSGAVSWHRRFGHDFVGGDLLLARLLPRLSPF